MQESDKNKSRLDDFSQLFKDRLKDYRLPPEDTDWQEMERLLVSGKRNRHNRLWLTGAAIAAAIATLLLILIPGINDLPHEEELTGLAIEKYIEETEKPVIPDQVVIPATPAPKPIVAQSRRLVTPPLVTRKNDSTKNIASEIPTLTEQIEEIITGEAEPVPAPEKKSEQDFYAFKDQTCQYIPVVKKKKKWQISTGVATGGNIQLNGFLDNDYATSPGGDMGNIDNPDPDPDEESETRFMTRSYKEIENELYPIDDYSSVHYSVPISVGFHVRKELNDRIAVETGLIYTYLSSELIYRQSIIKQSKLSLHYIGIPLNLVVDLWEQKNWEIYLSGGFMIEKGTRAILKQKEHLSNGIIHTTIRSGIPGVQWSLHLSPGVSYALSRQWKLYAEPRISYFMDNNQPISSRTDGQWTIGIGGGLRYQF